MAINIGYHKYEQFSLNPVLWLRADKGITLVDGKVSLWEDQSGNGYHASQSVNINKPLYVKNALNGKPILRFDGNNDFLDLPSFQSSSNQTYYIIGRKMGTKFFPLSSNSVSFASIYYNLSNNEDYVQVTGTQLGLGTITDLTQYSLVEIKLLPTTVTLWINSIYKAQGTTPGSDYQIFNSIGKYAGDGIEYLYGDISEIIIYNSALSDPERLSVEQYLKNKYGLI